MPPPRPCAAARACAAPRRAALPASLMRRPLSRAAAPGEETPGATVRVSTVLSRAAIEDRVRRPAAAPWYETCSREAVGLLPSPSLRNDCGLAAVRMERDSPAPCAVACGDE